MEIAYRCNRCGKIVFGYHLSYGSHCCRKCGSRRVEPIIEDLTWFGTWLLTIINNLGTFYCENFGDEEA